MNAVVRRLVTVVAAAVAAGVPIAAASAHTSSVSKSDGTQSLVILGKRVIARAAPRPGARAIAAVAARTPLTGSQTVLPVVQKVAGPAGGHWLRVRLPMRPNGVSGWIPAYAGAADTTRWRIVIHRGARRAVVYEGGRARATFSVVVGAPSTPTPLGTFFVVEKLNIGVGKLEGPWALATSAYSNVLQEFAGGPGQVALHGTTGLSGALGTFSSHGCVRFAPWAITWIARHVDDGTPIFINR